MNILVLFFVICLVLIDVVVNMMVVKLQGFCCWCWGVGVIVLVWIVFVLLGQVVCYMDLVMVYVMWGVIGVIGIVSCGCLLFGNCLWLIGWVGIVLVMVVVLLFSIVKQQYVWL